MKLPTIQVWSDIPDTVKRVLDLLDQYFNNIIDVEQSSLQIIEFPSRSVIIKLNGNNIHLSCEFWISLSYIEIHLENVSESSILELKDENLEEIKKILNAIFKCSVTIEEKHGIGSKTIISFTSDNKNILTVGPRYHGLFIPILAKTVTKRYKPWI